MVEIECGERGWRCVVDFPTIIPETNIHPAKNLIESIGGDYWSRILVIWRGFGLENSRYPVVKAGQPSPRRQLALGSHEGGERGTTLTVGLSNL